MPATQVGGKGPGASGGTSRRATAVRTPLVASSWGGGGSLESRGKALAQDVEVTRIVTNDLCQLLDACPLVLQDLCRTARGEDGGAGKVSDFHTGLRGRTLAPTPAAPLAKCWESARALGV